MDTTRLHGLDVFRGWAIVMMIVFHFFYNMQYFSLLDINLNKEHFWILFRILIVTIFLLSVGMSIKLMHKTIIRWDKVFMRIVIVGSAASLVTVATYFQFDNSYIYFGVLHFIVVSSLIGLIFLHIPYIAIFVSTAIFIGYALGVLNMHWLYEILQPLLNLPSHTIDLMQFFPWFGVVLLGIVIVSLGWHLVIFNNQFFSQGFFHNRFFSLLGRHSLVIYLIHQPILFGLTKLYMQG